MVPKILCIAKDGLYLKLIMSHAWEKSKTLRGKCIPAKTWVLNIRSTPGTLCLRGLFQRHGFALEKPFVHRSM
eukprot:8263024-Ditylum_brightwellii.AAC.2